MLAVKELSLAKVEDLSENPTKYGLPTFEQFAANPDKYRNVASADELLAQIDKGSLMLGRMVVGHEYWVGYYHVTSLEKAERLLREMGTTISKETFTAELKDIGAGKCKIVVKFKLPDE